MMIAFMMTSLVTIIVVMFMIMVLSMYNGLIYAQLLIQILCMKCSYLMCS